MMKLDIIFFLHAILVFGENCGIYAQVPDNSTSRNASGERSHYQSVSKSDRQRTIDELFENYDPRIPPNYEEDFPVTVIVQLHITNIDSISESNMDYAIGMFLRQTWNDSRLIYQEIPQLRSLELDSRLMNSIWVPDLFIANEKDAQFHLVTVPNKLMHIYPEGRVQYSIRISATLQCNMELQKYPLDSQICSVIMESYGYSTKILKFRWNENPVTRGENLQLAQFRFGQMRTFQCDKQYVEVRRWIPPKPGNGMMASNLIYSANLSRPHWLLPVVRKASEYMFHWLLNYTCITLQFELKRRFGYYITQIYIPSILIICLSWVSFWLDMDAVPARISLGLLTVLTMTTQSAGARSSLPKVSYVKGIDVWMATCLLFVFAALIEFAYVNVHARVEKRRRKSCVGTHTVQNENDDAEAEVDYMAKCQSRFHMFMPSREKARTCDRISRIAFPAVFLAFNIIYWTFYAVWTPANTTFS